MIDFKNRRVLVTGASGMIGIELVKLLILRGANVQAVSLDDVPSVSDMFGENLEFIKGDLRDFELCMKISKNKDFVFHLAGIKGSPEVAVSRPNTFFVNTTLFNLNLIETLNKYLLKNIKVGFTFLNIVNKKNLQERLKLRKSLNRYDKFRMSFYNKVQNGFLKLSKRQKNKYQLINSNLEIHNNEKLILNRIDKLIK